MIDSLMKGTADIGEMSSKLKKADDIKESTRTNGGDQSSDSKLTATNGVDDVMPEDDLKVVLKMNGKKYIMTMSEVYRRKKSLTLWKQHLLLLQWFEKRKEKNQVISSAKDDLRGTASEALVPLSMNAFGKGLKKMIKKVEALESLMEMKGLGINNRNTVELGHDIDSEVKATDDAHSVAREDTEASTLKRKRESPLKQMSMNKYCKVAEKGGIRIAK